MELDKVFNPNSVAVVGASTKPGSVGNDLVKNLVTQGFAGKVYPVNPKANSLYDQKCYPTLTAINKSVDLAVIVVPAAVVPQVLVEAGELSIPAVIIISAGFKETGNIELENEIARICREYDIALVGPNCLGIINPEINMNASFAALMPRSGPVAFISQSGALCTAVIDYANEMNLGFSKFMSIGNKAVLDELEIIKYLDSDPQTKVIALYAEELSKPQEIIELMKKVNRGESPKPIIVLKSGRTNAGASASASHTGALAGSDAAYDALFSQAGVIRANSVSQLFNFAKAFADNPLPRGNKIAIITNAGGPGVLTIDEAIGQGLELAALSTKTKEQLKSFLPAAANTENPVDVLGDAKAETYAKALETVAGDAEVNGLIVILTPQSMTEIEETAAAIVEVKKKTGKPILVSFMGKETVAPGIEIIKNNGVTNCDFPEQTARALAAMVNFASWRQETDLADFEFADINKEKVKEIFAEAKSNSQTSFPEAQALEILKAYNFPLLNSRVATSVEEAQRIAIDLLGEPVLDLIGDERGALQPTQGTVSLSNSANSSEVGGNKLALKIVSPDILHKTDAGGIMLNVEASEVGTKYEEIIATVRKNRPKAKLGGVLLVEMAPTGGTEFILGASTDPALGRMVMVGLGGVYVEVFKDVAFGLAPITRKDTEKMIASLKSNQILNGARGQAALDKEALIECLGRLSRLLTDFPEIVELDINPLLVLPNSLGAKALDARIVIQ